MNAYDFYITPEEYEEAEKNGISRQRLNTRVRSQGWSKEKAISVPPKHGIDRKVWIKIAEQNGVCRTTFYNRVNKLKWECERAAITPIVKPLGRSFKYSEEVYKKLKTNKIDRNTFYDRLKRGWNIEDACTRKTLTPKEIIKNLEELNKTNGNYFCKQQRVYRKGLYTSKIQNEKCS